MATTGLSGGGPSNSATTPSTVSSPAGSTHITRLPPNRLSAPASLGRIAGSLLIDDPLRISRLAPSAVISRSPSARACALSGPNIRNRRWRGSGWSTARPLLPRAGFTASPSSARCGARREQPQAGDDLVGEDVGQLLERGLLGGD